MKDRIKSNKHHLSLRVVVITIWGQSSYYKFKVSLPFTVILYLFCSPVFLKYGSNFTCRNIWSVSTKLFFYEVSKHGFCPLELESSWSFFFGLTYSSLLRKVEPAELWSKKCNRLRSQVKKRPTNFNQ